MVMFKPAVSLSLLLVLLFSVFLNGCQERPKPSPNASPATMPAQPPAHDAPPRQPVN
jgi:ABC-type uncharacterized transport system auxiliary subunit